MGENIDLTNVPDGSEQPQNSPESHEDDGTRNSKEPERSGSDGSNEITAQMAERFIDDRYNEHDGNASKTIDTLEAEANQYDRALTELRSQLEQYEVEAKSMRDAIEAIREYPEDQPLGVRFGGAILLSPPYPRDDVIERHTRRLESANEEIDQYNHRISEFTSELRIREIAMRELEGEAQRRSRRNSRDRREGEPQSVDHRSSVIDENGEELPTWMLDERAKGNTGPRNERR